MTSYCSYRDFTFPQFRRNEPRRTITTCGGVVEEYQQLENRRFVALLCLNATMRRRRPRQSTQRLASLSAHCSLVSDNLIRRRQLIPQKRREREVLVGGTAPAHAIPVLDHPAVSPCPRH